MFVDWSLQLQAMVVGSERAAFERHAWMMTSNDNTYTLGHFAGSDKVQHQTALLIQHASTVKFDGLITTNGKLHVHFLTFLSPFKHGFPNSPLPRNSSTNERSFILSLCSSAL
jgi:hypothetical protein